MRCGQYETQNFKILRMGENRLCIAQFDYQPQMVDELKLTKGDLVRLLEDVEDGWARGEVKIYF